MPEYLPFVAFRQGLLPEECRSCAWWQTTGMAAHQGSAAAGTRSRWLDEVEREWGHAGLLAYEPSGRRGAGPDGPVISGCIQFAPAASLPRLRELPFPALPPFSVLLFCLQTSDDAPHWAAKRLVRKALCELRSRGIADVYAVAEWSEGNGAAPHCRFLSAALLAESGFVEVAGNGRLRLRRVDNRSLLSLLDHVEAAVRRLFAQEREPAPSPAAWAETEPAQADRPSARPSGL
jgi:hypothetical protein